MDPTTEPPSTEEQQKKEALAAFTATLHSVGTNLEAPLRDRAATITSNTAALDRQEAELAEHTARLAKQNAQWSGFADETREGLKEIGDVQNWAEMIERDLLVLEEMMDGVEATEVREEEMGGHGHGHEDGDGDDMNGVVNRVNGLSVGNGQHGLWNGSDGKKKETRSWLRWW
ncbi:hypothetical protein N7448_004917 [Penicillium atrosanguineum]|uniref:Biogenesis of lysosome-related organelles complex 1 subunit 1 n=1 Tax=Penicillium atrosanguineum TaxID=1132637 RepID=A0A9W9H2R7_9EURO|nr:uncharacterized protein N7443_008665 [Penicillium atrosanguineum]KAJ5136363.1 hypothetical protein N7448_004917 [Penicillium atrosanguineum]KAJ5292712.1 hypothetical protein N7443_008665 [Penicillium atrosanguineum]KAJ5303263.1 hypothetical protein N7476_010062 [Penicillium atrosanguineum]